MKEDDRVTKEQEEKKRLMDEALAVAASAKKAQQERAMKVEAEKAEKKRLSDEASAITTALASSLNEKATISEEKPPVIPSDKKNEEIQMVEGTETDTSTEGDTTKPSEPPTAADAWVSVQCRLVNAGAAGLKVAADVGANLAAATAEVTRTSLQKVAFDVPLPPFLSQPQPLIYTLTQHTPYPCTHVLTTTIGIRSHENYRSSVCFCG